MVLKKEEEKQAQDGHLPPKIANQDLISFNLSQECSLLKVHLKFS